MVAHGWDFTLAHYCLTWRVWMLNMRYGWSRSFLHRLAAARCSKRGGSGHPTARHCCGMARDPIPSLELILEITRSKEPHVPRKSLHRVPIGPQGDDKESRLCAAH